jgi:chromosome segregation ATPase
MTTDTIKTLSAKITLLLEQRERFREEVRDITADLAHLQDKVDELLNHPQDLLEWTDQRIEQHAMFLWPGDMSEDMCHIEERK